MLDYDLSVTVAKKIKAQQQQCWQNAVRAIQARLPALAGAQYVEGFAASTRIPFAFDHGWLELPDRRIVDPTIVLLVDARDHAYFGGRWYTYEEVLRMREAHLPVVWKEFGMGGRRCPAYRQAEIDAWASGGVTI